MSDDTMNVSADMLHALTGDDEDRVLPAEKRGGQWTMSRGNIAAHAYNVTQGGGLEGINLGWKDQEESTAFLCDIVASVDEVWDEIRGSYDPSREWELLRDNGRDHEITDGAIPVGTYDRIQAALQLGATSVEDSGALPNANPGMEDIAAVALYELASSIVDGLMETLISNAEAVTA